MSGLRARLLGAGADDDDDGGHGAGERDPRELRGPAGAAGAGGAEAEAEASVRSSGSSFGSLAGRPSMGASAARRKAARAVREFEAAAREALRCKDEPRRVGPLAESATRSAEQARARLSELARECASLPAEEQQRVEPMNQRLVSAFEAQCKALDSGLRGAMAAQQEATGAATAGRRGDNPFGDGSFAPGQQQQQQMLQRQQQDEEQRAALEQRLLHEQAVFNQEDLSQRESEFTRLRQNVNQLNEISREVATLVHEQGEDIEAIGANVDTAHENTRGGLEELRKTAMYRRKVNPFTCGFAALLALFVIVLVVLLAKHKI